MQRADQIILLDLPTVQSLWRVIWRSIRDYREVRADMAPGCPEQFSLEFWIYTLRFRRDKRPGLLADLAPHEHKLLHFARPRATQDWMNTL